MCRIFPQPLDRDRPKGREQWQVLIKANDDGGDPTTTKSNVATVMIFVSDVNDNAPILDMVNFILYFNCEYILVPSMYNNFTLNSAF